MMKMTKKLLSGTLWLGRGAATIMGLAMLLALSVGLASTALAGTGVGARFNLGKINVVNDATTALQGSGPSSGTGPLLEVIREGANTGSTLRVENTNTQSFAPALQLKVPTGKIPMTVSTNAGTAVGLSADELDGKESFDFASATNGKANDADKLDGRDSSTFADAQAGKANDADKLDGLDSSFYLKIFSKAADADRLDGKDSAAFASATNGKADDADRLDGKDGSAFFSGRTYIITNEIIGNGPGGLGEVRATCDTGDAVLSGGFSGVTFATNNTDIVKRSFPEDPRTWLVEFSDNGLPNDRHSVFAICADFPPLR